MGEASGPVQLSTVTCQLPAPPHGRHYWPHPARHRGNRQQLYCFLMLDQQWVVYYSSMAFGGSGSNISCCTHNSANGAASSTNSSSSHGLSVSVCAGLHGAAAGAAVSSEVAAAAALPGGGRPCQWCHFHQWGRGLPVHDCISSGAGRGPTSPLGSLHQPPSLTQLP